MTRDELLKLYAEGKRDFSHADLRGAALRGANLAFANFSGTDLSGAKLSKAGLFNANLAHANLYNANLAHANLLFADLSNADLSKANLYNANLAHANLYNANLAHANLLFADLSNADLLGANFRGAKYKDVVIKHVRIFTSLYKYQVWAIIADDGSEWVRLGCFFRKREEWNENFWNNDEEFPNDNSEDSNMRLAAFNFACKWIDERKNAQTKEKTK